MSYGDTVYDDPKEELVEKITEELNGIRRKMTEMKSQIDQTQQMVDREQQRNSDYATEIQNMQSILDTVPREDIRDRYSEAMDARFRLATMRGQLEKFQTQYSMLETEQKLLSQLLTKFQGVDILDDPDAPSGESVSRVPNIVRIVEAQEEERQRLARQMHDGPAQSLTNFILQAEICERLFNRNPERAGEELNHLKTAASVTFQKVRDFIFDLRPMMLDDLGVVPTVRRYVESFKDKNDIETELEIVGEERRLQSHREVMTFRSIQELVGHVRDYADASNLRVRLDLSTSAIKIAVHDNGRGFDAEALFDETRDDDVQDARSKGLVALKERFDLVGGSIVVHSNETDGTLIRLELPAND
jgi:two-component system, NarL family, sensor histidine kinase DegS